MNQEKLDRSINLSKGEFSSQIVYFSFEVCSPKTSNVGTSSKSNIYAILIWVYFLVIASKIINETYVQ